METIRKSYRNSEFLGLDGYYRRFIKNFSKITKSLIELTKKHGKFIWNSKCEEKFQELKKCLTETPVLALPSGGDGFVIYTDASKDGLGCINAKWKSDCVCLS